MRMRLAMRTRIFLFFSLIMPLAFLFLYAVVFARSEPRAVAYMMPAVLALTVMGSFWGLSMQLVSFREQGILRRFRLAPVGPAAMLASGVISNYFLMLPTLVLEFLIAWWFFGVKQWGNLAGAFILVSLGAMAFATMGLIVASVANTMQETQAICNAVWFPLLFFSGATLPLPMLPGWLQKVALFLPSTYLVTGLQRMIVENASFLAVGGDLLALGGCLVTCFLVTTQTFRWEAEERIVGRAKLRAAVAVVPFLLIGAWEIAYGHRLADARAAFQSIQSRSGSTQSSTPPESPQK
jgi:ABC-2 type transport system permease protein